MHALQLILLHVLLANMDIILIQKLVVLIQLLFHNAQPKDQQLNV